VADPKRAPAWGAKPDQRRLGSAFIDDYVDPAIAIYVEQAAAFGECTLATENDTINALRQTPPQKPVAPGNERASSKT
jgi:hypothetical protein